MSMTIEQVTHTTRFARLILGGADGSGKTFTALRFLHGLPDSKVLMISSEGDRAGHYAFRKVDGVVWDYHVLKVDNKDPETFAKALEIGVRAGFNAILIDNITDMWTQTKLRVDSLGPKRGWASMGPIHDKTIQMMINAPAHIVCIVRSKVEVFTERASSGDRVETAAGEMEVGRGAIIRHKVPGKLDTKASVPFVFDVSLIMQADDFAQQPYGRVAKSSIETIETGSRWDAPGSDFAQAYHSFLARSEPVDEWMGRAIAAISEIGLDLNEVNAYLIKIGRPALQVLEPGRRSKCLSWLSGLSVEKVRAALDGSDE